MKEWKRHLSFANICISSGDIQVWKMCKWCKWHDGWCHTLNPLLHHVYKWRYLGQFAVQIIETWQANSSTENTTTATKNFVAMATLFSSPHPLDFHMAVIFSLKKVLQCHKLKLTYLYASWIMYIRHHLQIWKLPTDIENNFAHTCTLVWMANADGSTPRVLWHSSVPVSYTHLTLPTKA